MPKDVPTEAISVPIVFLGRPPPRTQHAAEAPRLRYAIERVDYGDGIALARELLAQLHRGWQQPGRQHGHPDA